MIQGQLKKPSCNKSQRSMKLDQDIRHMQWTAYCMVGNISGANFHEKSKVAARTNFCGFNFRDWMEAQRCCASMRTRSTKYAARCTCGVHAPTAMCVLLMIDWASCRSYTVCWAIAQAMERFSINSCVQGYHVYNDIWEASVSEELPCQRENGHAADPYNMLLGSRMLSAGWQ